MVSECVGLGLESAFGPVGMLHLLKQDVLINQVALARYDCLCLRKVLIWKAV